MAPPRLRSGSRRLKNPSFRIVLSSSNKIVGCALEPVHEILNEAETQVRGNTTLREKPFYKSVALQQQRYCIIGAGKAK